MTKPFHLHVQYPGLSVRMRAKRPLLGVDNTREEEGSCQERDI
jgi:hypothetical protein